jgi:hypothetical protein
MGAHYAPSGINDVNTCFAILAPIHHIGHTNAIHAMGLFSALMF